jgi:hypothetical protein
MLDILWWLIGAPTWLVGGGFTARKAVAVAERHYIQLSKEAHARDSRNPIQDKMDSDDWIGAGFFAAGAFALFPAVAAAWLLSKPAKVVYKPLRAFFVPPIQKEFEVHVESMEAQKDLILSTARTYEDVLNWEPKDHPDRVKLLTDLQQQIVQQMTDLMKMSDPSRGWDGNFLESTKGQVKELTAGETWR